MVKRINGSRRDVSPRMSIRDFDKLNLTYGGLVSGLNQFLLLPQQPLKLLFKWSKVLLLSISLLSTANTVVVHLKDDN